MYLVISILRDTNTNTNTYANNKTNTNTDQSAKRCTVSENINTALQYQCLAILTPALWPQPARNQLRTVFSPMDLLIGGFVLCFDNGVAGYINEYR